MADTTLAYNQNADTVTGTGGTALQQTSNPLITPVPPAPSTSLVTGVTPQTATPSTPPKQTPVISAQPAADNNQTILQEMQKQLDSIKTQADKLTAQKAATDAKAAQDAKDAQQTNLQQQQINQKNSLISAATGTTKQVTAPDGNSYTVDASGNIVSGPTNGKYSIGSNVSQYPELAGQVNGTNTNGDIYNSSEVSSYNAKLDTAYNDYNTKVTGIQNGTIPLTPEQQAQIDSVKQQFAQMREAQLKANTAIQGANQVAGFRAGRTEYTPEIEAGNIKAVIDEGISKINDLDAKAANTIAQMSQQFKNDDIKAAADSYNQFTKYMEEKQKTITDFHNDVVKQATDLRNYNLDLSKFQETVAKDSADLTLKQQDQKEKEAMDTFERNYKTEDLALKRREVAIKEQQAVMENSMFSGGALSANPVEVDPTGAPNSQQQSAFLATLPPMTQQIVKSLANYTFDPKLTRMSEGARTQLLTLAHQYDPTFDEGQYSNAHKVIQNFTSGKYSQNINSLNTAVSHIGTLADTLGGFSNGDITKFNSVGNYIASNFGNGKVTAVQTELSAISTEMAAALKTSGATDVEIEKFQKGLSVNSSPAQFKAAVETLSTLLGGRLNSLNETYQEGVGKPPSSSLILHPEAQRVLSTLKDAGFNINVPGVPFTNSQSFYSSSPKNAQVWNDTLTQMQQLEAQGAIDPNKIYDPKDVLKLIYVAHPELLQTDLSGITTPGAAKDTQGAQDNNYPLSFING